MLLKCSLLFFCSIKTLFVLKTFRNYEEPFLLYVALYIYWLYGKLYTTLPFSACLVLSVLNDKAFEHMLYGAGITENRIPNRGLASKMV